MDATKRIDEINAFMGYVVGEWPSIQPQVADQLSRRCSKCILSENCYSDFLICHVRMRSLV